MRNACSSFARNANPTNAPVAANHRTDPCSTARTVQYAAIVSSSTNMASGLLKRNITAATGVVATTAPARRPATGPNHRFTAAYRTATVATPSSAWGTRIDHELTPNTRAARSIGHRNSGVLSTVMKFDASDEPKKNAFQLCDPACTAAE